jgi:AcrR family transcriptional regulator
MARKIDPSKRTAIMNAGRAILLRDGYTAAKMSDIAAEAGVAPGTLYLYFESKDALAGAIGEDFFCTLGENMTKLIKNLDAPANVNELVEFVLRIGTEERDLLALLKQRMPDPGRDENSRRAQFACDENNPRTQFKKQLAAVLEELMKKVEVRQYEPYPLAEVVLSILHGLMMSCIFSQTTDVGPLKSCAVTVLQHALFTDEALAAIEHESENPSSALRSASSNKGKALA